MQVQWSFEGCENNIKNNCRSYWGKKQQRVERILSSVPDGSKKLRLTLYCHDGQVDKFEVRGIMNLPGRTLAVQSTDLELNAVLDELADKLASAAQKYKDQSFHFLRHRRKQQTSDDLFAAQPLLSWDIKSDRKDSFFATLRPLLSFLERRARNEIKVFELEGVLSPGQIEPAELVDEVVLLAWEKFGEKPDNLSLEFWLVRLLQEVLNRVEWEYQFVSLDQKLSLADQDITSEPDWFEAVLGYKEEFSLAELVPDYDETEEWEDLDEVGRNLHFYDVIQKFPSYQRQAYLLHAVNEYSLKEVAEIQGRSLKEVESDISKSTKAMKDYMLGAGMVRKRKIARCGNE